VHAFKNKQKKHVVNWKFRLYQNKRVWKNVTWSWPLHNLVEKVVSAKVVFNVSRQSTISAHVQHNLVQIDVTSNWADEKNPFYGFHSKKHEPMIIWWHDLEVQSVTYTKTIFIFNCNSKDLNPRQLFVYKPVRRVASPTGMDLFFVNRIGCFQFLFFSVSMEFISIVAELLVVWTLPKNFFGEKKFSPLCDLRN